MTNEKREAIKNLDEIVNLSKEELQKENENITAILDYEDLKSLDTVLSLIKEQQEEIDMKDKQIELMARAIDNYDSQLEINTFKDKEHIKQYFGELAKKE